MRSKALTKVSRRGAFATRLSAALLIVVLASPASGADFFIETAHSYRFNGCDSDCSQSATLNYADDRARYFESAMIRFGETKRAHYVDSSVHASDWKEDALGGEDSLYGDTARFLSVTGHGNSFLYDSNQSDPRFARFTQWTCKRGTSNSCKLTSGNVLLGEQSGTFPGSARFMMIWACCSVHIGAPGGKLFSGCTAPSGNPRDQWLASFSTGTDYIMGYKGMVWDSDTTDETSEDFAEEAYESGFRFKPSWFYANEDWSEDNVASVVASGSSEAAAISRRDFTRKTSARRGASEVHDWVYWSWHRG